jgi:DNA-binding IclR family transcriptional regulator
VLVEALHVLDTLVRGPHTIAELAEATMLGPRTVRRIIAVLEGEAWVRRVPALPDGVGRPASRYRLRRRL